MPGNNGVFFWDLKNLSNKKEKEKQSKTDELQDGNNPNKGENPDESQSDPNNSQQNNGQKSNDNMQDRGDSGAEQNDQQTQDNSHNKQTQNNSDEKDNQKQSGSDSREQGDSGDGRGNSPGNGQNNNQQDLNNQSQDNQGYGNSGSGDNPTQNQGTPDTSQDNLGQEPSNNQQDISDSKAGERGATNQNNSDNNHATDSPDEGLKNEQGNDIPERSESESNGDSSGENFSNGQKSNQQGSNNNQQRNENHNVQQRNEDSNGMQSDSNNVKENNQPQANQTDNGESEDGEQAANDENGQGESVKKKESKEQDLNKGQENKDKALSDDSAEKDDTNVEEKDGQKQKDSEKDNPDEVIDKENEEQRQKQAHETREYFKNLLKEFDQTASQSKGDGYSIDSDSNAEVPDSVISMLIEKFLNEKILAANTDLNQRSNSMKTDRGNSRWDMTKMVKDIVDKNLIEVPNDKIGYKFEEGKNEQIPFSFYFDLSGSMSEYTKLLSLIAVALVKHNVKILTGFNERVQVQVDQVPSTFSVQDFKEFLEVAYSAEALKNDKRFKTIKCKYLDQNIDEYLTKSKAKKVVIFSDFDPGFNVVQLSKECDVYWFSFERRFRDLRQYSECKGASLHDFKGKYYITQSIKDFSMHLKHISSTLYEKRQRQIQLQEESEFNY